LNGATWRSLDAFAAKMGHSQEGLFHAGMQSLASTGPQAHHLAMIW
jgi:hypothetical protein